MGDPALFLIDQLQASEGNTEEMVSGVDSSYEREATVLEKTT